MKINALVAQNATSPLTTDSVALRPMQHHDVKIEILYLRRLSFRSAYGAQ